jgi:hypothetical protein
MYREPRLQQSPKECDEWSRFVVNILTYERQLEIIHPKRKPRLFVRLKKKIEDLVDYCGRVMNSSRLARVVAGSW